MRSELNSNVLRIGTRRSLLAKSQTTWVADRLLKFHPQLQIQIIEVVTTGDKILDTSLSQMPGKGVFVKEIEEMLLAGEIDLAVHSLKDLPTEFPAGLKIAAIPERVDPRDVFISRHKKNLLEMPAGAKIGTSSLRRSAQLSQFRSDFHLVDIRGNIDTRLRKAESEEYDGIILAAAGLTRLGLLERVQEFLSCEVMIPAAGQGALGIEIREDDQTSERLLSVVHDPVTATAVQAERTFLEGMGGGCQTPIGAFCRIRESRVVFHACALQETQGFLRVKLEGDLVDAMHLADELILRFKAESTDV